MDKALEMYNKVFDKIVPWSELNRTISKLDEYRDDYSKEAAALLGEIKTKMMNGMDAYHRSVQSIYEWCGFTLKTLKMYKKLFENKSRSVDSIYNTTRKLLLKTLTNGIDKMEKAKEALDDSSRSFNESAGKLTSLNGRLKSDFDKNSEYYQSQITRIRAVAYGTGAAFGLFGIGMYSMNMFSIV